MLESITADVTNDPIRYAAPVVAGVFLLITYYQARKGRRGPEAEFWEFVRGTAIPTLDTVGRALDIGYAAYTVGYHEYAGTLDMPPEEAEEFLYEHGFRRNPLSAYKTVPDGREEQGSWVDREHLLAKWQLHVMTFEREGGRTDCFAHWELSAINPLTALGHYRGKNYSPEKGETKLAERLPRGSLKKRPIHPDEREAEKRIREKQQQNQQQQESGTGSQTAEA